MNEFFKREKSRIFLLVLLLGDLLCASCVNTIQEETSESGTVPIVLSTSVKTRVANNKFEEKDTIGVFLLSGEHTLATERYMDNVPYLSQKAVPVSGKEFYYPAGNEDCTFISYYPYKKEIVSQGENKMHINVYPDQSKAENYTYSDFLMAKVNNIKPSSKAVTLNHSHKLSLLDIILEPEEGSNVSDLLKADPTVTITDVYTKGKIDVETNDINGFAQKCDMIPYGTWEESDGKLIGKSIIMIPQKIAGGTALLRLNIEGRDFVCRMDNDLDLAVSQKSTVTIPCSKWEVGNVEISISEWENGNSGTAHMESSEEGINISGLSFDRSNIYDIYNKGVHIAQICKEYLYGQGIDTKAIVAYPISDEQADLSHGTVLKLYDGNGHNVGGTASWNRSTNKLTYTPGNQEETSTVYMDDNHNFLFTKPTAPLSISVKPDMLVDVRGNETITYPKVKIGTQYWMGEELATSKYTDGTSIPVKEALIQSDLSAACVAANNGIFYNFAAVNTHKLSPSGWAMPAKSDWNILFTYLNNDISKLKTATWNTSKYPATDITGFDITGRGYVGNFDKEKETTGIYDCADKGAAYWYVSSINDAEGRYMFWYQLIDVDDAELYPNNTISNVYGTKGYSIRCLKK